MEEEKKKVSKAQQRATNKYIATHYDRINITVPKGEKKLVQEHAAAQEESVNAFVKRAIKLAMEADSQKVLL